MNKNKEKTIFELCSVTNRTGHRLKYEGEDDPQLIR